MEEIKEKKEVNKAQIYTPADVKDKMFDQLRKGKVKGTTTYNTNLDKAWKWRQQEATIWTGYANEGKSIFLKQCCMIKALEENKNFAFSAPEDFPPEEFFDDMIHTLAGVSTDKDNNNHITEEYYEMAYELIKDHFYFVYMKPPNNTIKGALEAFKNLMKEVEIYGCIIDPLLKFSRPKDFSERDDIYASYIGSIMVDFCRETNTCSHLVMHQVTPTFDEVNGKDGEKKRRYAEPSMYRMKGGGSWADGFDNVISIWRPDYANNKLDTSVRFSSQKIKKQKLVGIPQTIELDFDRKSNRYCDKGTNYPIFNFDKFMYDN